MLIIYISGIDGCGKTTQSKLLVDTLVDRGLDVCYLWLRWEPSFRRMFRFFRLIIAGRKKNENLDIQKVENLVENNWLDFKRRVLTNAWIRKIWWFHACADYYYSSRKRFRSLDAEIIVIDRYLDDFIIDQACNLALPPERAYILANNIFLKRFMAPDLRIVIDLPASEGYARKRDGTSLNYLKRRELYYKSLSASDNTVHLNGLDDVLSLAKQIESCARNMLAGL